MNYLQIGAHTLLSPLFKRPVSRLPALLCLSLIMAGCVPLDVRDPYPDSALQMLLASQPSKETVIETFGLPHAKRLDGRFWVYGQSVSAMGIKGDKNELTIKDYSWLLLRFDRRGQLTGIERNDDKNGCASDGICLQDGWELCEGTRCNGNQRHRLNDKITLLTAPNALTTRLRDPRIGHCPLYIFYESRLPQWLSYGAQVSTDRLSAQIQHIDNQTYVFQHIKSGAVTVRSWDLDSDGEPTPSTQLTLTCRPPSALYVQLRSTQLIPGQYEPPALSSVPANRAAREIETRKLLLPRSSRQFGADAAALLNQ